MSRDGHMQAAGLYIHFPFCKRKCNYCDFLSFAVEKETEDRYMSALLRELRLIRKAAQDKDIKIVSVFLGGGTPSILLPEHITMVMDIVSGFNLASGAEITLECNPGTLSFEKLKAYRRAGINRLSMGLQSADDYELKILGRIHTYKDFEDNFLQARKAGFTNINVDIMSALPNQTLAVYERTLKIVAGLGPEHISAYSLIVEEGTPFYHMDLNLPDENEDRLMYHRTKDILKDFGYERYEISNYALPGRQSVHNKLYWIRDNYLGAGLGAASMYENVRYSRIRDMDRYIDILERTDEFTDPLLLDDLSEDVRALPVREQMEEYCYLGMRLCEGISLSGFKKEFGVDFMDIYGTVVSKYTAMKLLKLDGGRLRLTDEGIDVSNIVFADFLLD